MSDSTGVGMKVDDNHVYWEIYGANCDIAAGVHIGPFSSILCHIGIKIEEGTIIGPSATIVDSDHEIDPEKDLHTLGKQAKIHIGKFCWIGANAVILKGVTLGDRCVVGAGSVVVGGAYTAGSVLVGVPAKVIKVRDVL